MPAEQTDAEPHHSERNGDQYTAGTSGDQPLEADDGHVLPAGDADHGNGRQTAVATALRTALKTATVISLLA